MSFRRRFTLLGMVWITALATHVAWGANALPQPMPMSIQCRDGRVLKGDVTSWDQDGATGSFGMVPWSELTADDAVHVLGRMIDGNLAEHWQDMGQALSKVEGGAAHAQRALRMASWLDTIKPAADQASRVAPPRLVEPSPAADKARDAQRHAWKHAEPWPPLSAEEQAQAVVSMKQESAAVFKALGLTMQTYESDFALFYFNVPEPEARPYLNGISATYLSLLRSFRMPADANIFWGKAVVILFARQEEFARFHQRVFAEVVRPDMAGMCSPVGPKVICSFWMLPDDKKLSATVPHEFTHGFLHRYRSPRQLPLWLEEGFADFVAALVLEGSPIDEARRPTGQWFIRTGGPIDVILDMQCVHDGWPGPRQAGYGVSYLLVKTMFELRGGFKVLDCITAIKEGKPWESALEEDFGMGREALVKSLTERVAADKPSPPIRKPRGPSDPPIERPRDERSTP